MFDPETLRLYRMQVALSADDASALRPCDVLRVVESALDGGLEGFPAWLRSMRPDLTGAVLEAVALAGEG